MRTSSRPPLGAYVRGPSALIIWRDCHEVLQERLRKLELDPGVHRDLVRSFRNTIGDLETAALESRDWEMARAATDSAERSGSVLDAGLERPSRLDTKSVAAILDCQERWVTQLCVTGRLVAIKRGRAWEIDPESVEDFKKGIAA
jgi:hypothetical protein